MLRGDLVEQRVDEAHRRLADGQQQVVPENDLPCNTHTPRAMRQSTDHRVREANGRSNRRQSRRVTEGHTDEETAGLTMAAMRGVEAEVPEDSEISPPMIVM